VFPGKPLRAAVATGLLWGIWHYPLLLVTGSTPLTFVAFTAGTVTMSVFLGWLQHRAGSVWAPSLGHAANNVTEDNLTRAGFGHGPLSAGASFSVLVAEAVVLLGIVALDRCARGSGR
jgi:membrane protease YdiL (CAAX protease family)